MNFFFVLRFGIAGFSTAPEPLILNTFHLENSFPI